MHNPQDSGSLSANLVFHIFEDRLGNLWAGTVGGGLNRLDRSTGRFSRFHDPNNPHSPGDDTSDQALSQIREDHSGVLWVGNALGTLDPKTGSLTPYAFRSKEPGGEIVTNVRAIQEDQDAVLWLGTQNGLLALDRERKQFVRYIKNPANPHSLHNDDILSLFEDAEGNIWVGTQSGLSRFNRKPRFINRQVSGRQYTKPGGQHYPGRAIGQPGGPLGRYPPWPPAPGSENRPIHPLPARSPRLPQPLE